MNTESNRLDQLEAPILGPGWPLLVLLAVVTAGLLLLGLDHEAVVVIMFCASFALAIIRTVWTIKHAPVDDD